MASRGVNKVILIGNLGQDPDIRTLNSGDQVANFSIATSDTWNDKNTGELRERTEWHRCVAFRRLAEIIGQYVRKGSKVYVEGRLQTRQWQDKEGQTRYTTEINVDNLQMLDSRSGGSANFDSPSQQSNSNNNGQSYNQGNAPAQRNTTPSKPAQPAQPAQGFGPDPDAGFDDDDIPF